MLRHRLQLRRVPGVDEHCGRLRDCGSHGSAFVLADGRSDGFTNSLADVRSYGIAYCSSDGYADGCTHDGRANGRADDGTDRRADGGAYDGTDGGAHVVSYVVADGCSATTTSSPNLHAAVAPPARRSRPTSDVVTVTTAPPSVDPKDGATAET